MLFNLRDYIIRAEGPWAASALTEPLILRHAEDVVEFGGPLTVNVSAEVENEFIPQAGVEANHLRRASSSLFSYDVNIQAGYKWAFAVRQMPLSALAMHGARIVIRHSPCAPEVCEPDLPCDFAVKHSPDCGCFFPSACEPCGGGPIRMPATCRPSLTVAPASGGCVRPRFFNGMFITREDMETELRYFRVKNNLQRRADGQGVVWGFGLGRDGRSICVHPGYGVDCCGNDLTVTCTYKVGVAELLTDPAICHRRGGERECFALLLEYVECPEDPRPVHGEPCVGMPAGCEMSRVRETVRLRLVPERKHCVESPIARLFNKPRHQDECCGEKRPEWNEWPCLADPCCGHEPLFPCAPPWRELDERGRPAGPRAAALAIVYALLAGTIATEDVVKGENPKVKAAADLFQATATLLQAEASKTGELDKLAVKVRQLLADWCCSLLYPGPTCDCEIHGVVIGRAILCGDEIESIDPWAGRRWVMHYPLVAYWGEQFGVVPPDILASRLFDLICCVSRLEPPSCEALCSGDKGREAFEFAMPGGAIRVRKSGTRRSGHREPNVHRTQTVSLHDFGRHALGAMIAGEPPADGSFVELQLEGCPEVSLLVLDPTAPPVRAEEEHAPRGSGERRAGTPGAAPTPETDWIEALVREALEVTRTRRTHRSLPMLRAFGARLAGGLSRILPLSATAPPPSDQLVEALERDNVVTIGDLLQHPPESLAAALDDRTLVGPLSDLIQRGEARVHFVTDAVVDSLKSVADQHGLVSADDLSASGTGRAALAETLAQRLSLPRESIARQVSESLP